MGSLGCAFSCAVQFSVRFVVILPGLPLALLQQYEGSTEQQQLCHEAVPHPGVEDARFSILVLNKKDNKTKAVSLGLFFWFVLTITEHLEPEEGKWQS